MGQKAPYHFAESDREVHSSFIDLRRRCHLFVNLSVGLSGMEDGPTCFDWCKMQSWTPTIHGSGPTAVWDDDWGWMQDKSGSSTYQSYWTSPDELIWPATEDRSWSMLYRTDSASQTRSGIGWGQAAATANYTCYRDGSFLYFKPSADDWVRYDGLASNPQSTFEHVHVAMHPTTGTDATFDCWFDGETQSFTRETDLYTNADQYFGRIGYFEASPTLSWNGAFLKADVYEGLISQEDVTALFYDPWGPVRWIPRTIVTVSAPTGGASPQTVTPSAADATSDCPAITLVYDQVVSPGAADSASDCPAATSFDPSQLLVVSDAIVVQIKTTDAITFHLLDNDAITFQIRP